VFPPVTDNPSLAHAAEGLKQLGRVLGPTRDWDVFMTETAPHVEAALPEQPGLRVLLRAGARRRRAAHASLSAYLNSTAFRVLTLELACFAATVATLETLSPHDAGLGGAHNPGAHARGALSHGRDAHVALAGEQLSDGADVVRADGMRTDGSRDSGNLAKRAIAAVGGAVSANRSFAEESVAAMAVADAAAIHEALAGGAGTKEARADWPGLEADAAAVAPAREMLSPTLTEFAAGVLRKRWRRLRNVGIALDDRDNPGLHGLRLKAKRLRYAAEFFAPLFPEKPTTRFIRRLAVLQERLGLFNDTTVAETLLRELYGKPNYAAGLVLGFTAARGSRARPKIAAAWARLRRRDPFWMA
jgi:CHAD domain-containing protein